jgi:hypothetical protein
MKKLYFIIIAGLSAAALNAQSLSPQIIASAGAYSTSTNNSLSYTVGEMTMIQTFSSNGNILTQGFQQPNEKTVGLLDITQDDYGSFVVYPNPAVDNFWFGFQLPAQGKVTISIFDELGQKIGDIYNTEYQTGKIVQQSNCASLASGLYFVSMVVTGTPDGKTHTISKKLQVIR